jgi:hypothetical protein
VINVRKIAFVLVVVVAAILLQSVFFYRGVYSAPPANLQDVGSINISSYYVPGEFSDVYEKGNGTVLFDFSHRNNFDPEELNVLLCRIISRGNFDYLDEDENLEEELKNASSFVVILPTVPFSEEEINQTKHFVDGGGRLMMIADPTRKSEINTLSSHFGIIFWNDYLYNLKDNDGNFQYIFLTDFKENNLTRDLEKIVFYTACSIVSEGNGIAFTDENTYSSSKEIKGKYSPLVLANDFNVLAVGDLTFFVEPYNVLDNDQLIANIADYLTGPVPGPVPSSANDTVA